MRSNNRVRNVALAAAVAALAAGAVLAAAHASAADGDFPPDARFDYQISTPYDPEEFPATRGVRVVSRDVGADPAPVDYNLCYVNGFQTQPDPEDGPDPEAEGTSAWFVADPERASLLLANPTPEIPTRIGDPYARDWYVDPGWELEIMFDIGTPANLRPLADIVGRRIAECATKGFDAVEIDNLDTFTRALADAEDRRAAARAAEEGEDFDAEGRPKLFTEQDALDFAGLLIGRAHALGLEVAQKNTAEFEDRGRAAGFDLAVVEECGATEECADYAEVYGDRWVDIEYSDEGFTAACDAVGDRISVVRRDLDVSAPGDDGYAYQEC